MPELSVIIPARKEEYLSLTVEKIAAARRGDTEIIVVIDGEEAGPPVPELPGVRIIRHEKPTGQRASVNEAARLSSAKYILKTDGHSMLDEGFDVKLPADCEYDWTVLPRMYNLHAHDLVCRKCGFRGYNRGAHRPCPKCGVTDYDTQIVFEPNWKRQTDFMWFRSPTCKDRPLRVQYWGGKDWVCDACQARFEAIPDNAHCDNCNGEKFHKELGWEKERMAHKRWVKQQGGIADVMTGQGACFFLHRERFLELGGLDEAHGSWGQVGVEVACKAWLSGGRHVVNRKTWFAHLFRCGDGQSFPYQIHASDQEKARQYSIDLWTSGRWEKQVRPLEWIVGRFWPVPTWAKPSALIMATSKPFTRKPTDGANRYMCSRCGHSFEFGEAVVIGTSFEIVSPEEYNIYGCPRCAAAEYTWIGEDGTQGQAADDSPYGITIDPHCEEIRMEAVPPVPTWPENPRVVPDVPEHAPASVATATPERLTQPDLTVLCYTDGSLPVEFSNAVHAQLIAAKGSLPLVVQQQPSDWPRTHESIYRNILAGLEKVTTPYVALAEHDVLYPPGYFNHRPKADIDYNVNRWCLHADRGIYSRRREWAMSQMFAKTDILRENIRLRLRNWPEDKACLKGNFEPGRGDWALGLPPITVHRFKSKRPTLDITGHGYNLTGPKNPRTKPCDEAPYWGAAAEVLERFCVPRPTAKDLRIHLTVDTTAFEAGVEEAKRVLDKLAGKLKVSILIPARNEPYLEATVKDLLQKLRLPFEIIVGLDGPDQSVAVPSCDTSTKRVAWDDARVRVIQSDTRIGMRPLINRLAREAKGEYLIRMDAHCMIAEGMDKALVEVCEREGHVGVVAMRYELDAKRWQRRDRTDIPYRRLSHESEDGCGLRSLPWPEYAEAHRDEVVGETMSCSGSSWTCRRETFLSWGGFDEQHGVFGQEGCEIACMFWLSGGRFLVHKGTWYAHHNRGKAPYTLGAHVKKQSISRSKDLWVGNEWKHARYGFDWLIEKFRPPGWPAPAPLPKDVARAIKPHAQRALIKTNKRLLVSDLWAARDEIADPGKRHRLTIFWRSFDLFVRDVLAGNVPDKDHQYRHYLLTHVNRHPGQQPTKRDIRKVEKSLAGAIGLIKSVAKEGLKAPLEFYQQDGRMILWKGYRRLVIARAVGIPRVVGRCFADRQAAGALSPQSNLTRLQNPPVEDLHKLAEEQFRRWGNGATDKYFTHNYTRYYDVHLHSIRKRVKKVLELGLLNGASLALWRDYFPRAELFGVDIEPERWKKFAGNLPNSKIMVGSETDPAFMRTVATAGPFDLIVDDASHDPLLQRQAFKALWPAVRQYGYYVIEDVFRGYDGGESQKPPGLPLGFEQHIYSQRDVLSIHHYYNIAFIQKA